MTDPYVAVRAHFESDDDVEVNQGRGSQGLKYRGKLFVMFLKGDLLVKLNPDRVLELASKGAGERYDPGTGAYMMDRILIRQTEKEHWIEYCEESLRHVRD